MVKLLRDEQIAIRMSRKLRQALEEEAAIEDRKITSLIRSILIDHAGRRAVARERSAAESQNHEAA